MKSPAILRIFKDKQLVAIKQFEIDQIILGSGSEAQVVLDDPDVSTIHCLIELRESGYFLSDLGSASGTFKNDTQVLDEALSSGDKIKVGPYDVHFFVGIPNLKPTAEFAAPTLKAQSVLKPEAQKQVSKPIPPKTSAEPPPPAAKKVNIPLAPPKLPLAGKAGSLLANKKVVSSRRKRSGRTFAPSSEITDLREYLQPTKGSVLEVIVAWKERVISSHHFKNKKKITIGSFSNCDIVVPSTFISGRSVLIDTTEGTRVNLNSSMTAEILRQENKFDGESLKSVIKSIKNITGPMVKIEQGELLAILVQDGSLQIYIRHVQLSSTPSMAGMDLSGSELTGLVVSAVLVALLALYMSVYGPSLKTEEPPEEQLRMAQFIYKKKEEPKKIVIQEKPAPIIEKPKKEKPATGKSANVKNVAKLKASEIRALQNKNRPKKFTSVKHGGSVKIGNKGGANVQSSRDVTKEGLLSAFGGEGNRSKLDKAYSGSGDLLGMADRATGNSGQSENRSGDDLGSKLKDTGAGGKGTATQGISGVGTKGRSSGQSSYGEVRVGGKGRVAIDTGGEDAEFVGTVDKDAVRRVVRSIYSQIKGCYDRALKFNSNLEGKIIIHWAVFDKGVVKVARMTEGPSDLGEVGNCVARRIRAQKFPDPPAGSYYEVNYPFMMGKQK